MAKEWRECGLPSTTHLRAPSESKGRVEMKANSEGGKLHRLLKWIEDLLVFILPSQILSFIPELVSQGLENFLIKFLIFLGVIKRERNFPSNLIPLRTATFINEAKKKNLEFEAFRGPFGYLNYFQMRFKRKNFLFEGLPRAEFLNSHKSQIIDDKYLVKKNLKKAGLPVLDGKAFWWFQKKKALKFATQLGFPLVVKPRKGSLSSHITTDVQDINSLIIAIDRAISYSPIFVIEKFLGPACGRVAGGWRPQSYVYRATVIDFKKVFCVQQIPANIVGDGIHTIKELILIKNNDKKRGNSQQKDTILSKIVINETTEKLLQKRGYNFSTIPQKGEIIYLQRDSFLKLGGDLIEVTPLVNPDNLQLFQKVAKFFGTRLVGIDFLAEDISLSWKIQSSAILELNSLPCIEMHHFPSSGKPQNVAKEILKMVFKYY